MEIYNSWTFFLALKNNFVGNLKLEGIHSLPKHELIEGTKLIVRDLIHVFLAIFLSACQLLAY